MKKSQKIKWIFGEWLYRIACNLLLSVEGLEKPSPYADLVPLTPTQRLLKVMIDQNVDILKLTNLTKINFGRVVNYCFGTETPSNAHKHRIATSLGITTELIWGSGAPEEEKGE